MHGTVPQKIGRVIGNLIAHPQYISRCVAHNLINGKTPLDLEIPWFSYGAIDFLEEHVLPDMSVFEYGSGGSTLFFARRTRKVTSVEDNPQWFEWVSGRLKQKGLTNASLSLRQFNFKEPVEFEKSEYLNALPDEKFDIIVIDGSEEWTQVRPICFAKAEGRIKKGGIIIVDDSWRYPTLRKNHHARNLKIFQSVGPCRPGVTSTDIFFY
jgi:hypothetical protein